MIEVPYDFPGAVTYHKYSNVENRIRQFSDYEILGKDASGEYDMYVIKLGNPNKPAILITAGVHGVEWQSTEYSLSAFQMLENDTYPDSEFRDQLLNDFYLIYMPCLNPWGLDNLTDTKAPTIRAYYRNSNHVDINRDFVNQTQAETLHVMDVVERFDPFAHMDLHLFQPNGGIGLEGYDLIMGTEIEQTQSNMHNIANALEEYTGYEVNRWDIQPERHHMVRGSTTFRKNQFTGTTMTFLSEIERPDSHTNQAVSDAQIYEWGNAFLYIFFKEAIEYYMVNSQGTGSVEVIETPTKTIRVQRDSTGVTESITEEFKTGRTLKSTLTRNVNGEVIYIDKEILSE